MQKLMIVKKKFMNIDMKNIFTALFKKWKHLKSSLQISSFLFAAMHNAK